jgi:membrane protease YdiL (CAAX protease family)
MSFTGDSDNETPEFTAELGVVLSLAAALVAFLATQMLFFMIGPSSAAVGIGAILGFGGALFVSRPFISKPAELGLRPPPPRAWIAALLLVPVPLLASELENLVHAYLVARPSLPEPEEVRKVTAAMHAEQLLVTAVVLPVVTELFFRGFLQPRMTPFWGRHGAWLGASGLAAVAWVLQIPNVYAVRGLILILPVILLLGLLRRVSGSIFPGLLLGVAIGLTQFGASMKWFGIPGFDLTDGNAHTPLQILALPAAMTGIALALCRGRASPPEERGARSGRRRADP